MAEILFKQLRRLCRGFCQNTRVRKCISSTYFSQTRIRRKRKQATKDEIRKKERKTGKITRRKQTEKRKEKEKKKRAKNIKFTQITYMRLNSPITRHNKKKKEAKIFLQKYNFYFKKQTRSTSREFVSF